MTKTSLGRIFGSIGARRNFLVVATAATFATHIVVAAQLAVHGDQVFLLEEARPRILTTQDLATGEQRELYKTDLGRIFDYKVSPSGEMIAVLEQVLQYDVDSQIANVQVRKRSVFERATLHIIDNMGNPIDDIQNVRRFSWSPDGRGLTYVTGEFQSPYESYANTKAWIWSATDESEKEISNRGSYVHWAAFDGRVYLWEQIDGIAGKVYAYSPLSGSVTETSHKSIYFSPTGAYYYHPGGGIGLRENVYVRSGDLGLKDASRTLADFCGFRPIAWAPGNDLLLLEACRKAPSGRGEENVMMIYDPSADTAVEAGRAESIAWGNQPSELIVKNKNRLERWQAPPRSQ
jgi:hypothetical protein